MQSKIRIVVNADWCFILTRFFPTDATRIGERVASEGERGTANDLRHFYYNLIGFICQVKFKNTLILIYKLAVANFSEPDKVNVGQAIDEGLNSNASP